MQHVSFACGPARYREILERLKANGITIDAGPLLVIPPAIHSFYFFDPNGIRLEISSDLDGDEEDLQGHCQLKPGWYPPAVGGAAVRCREVLGTPIGLSPLKREGPRRSTRPS